MGPDLFQWGQEADEQNQCVFFWCSAEPKKKSNAAVLVCDASSLASLHKLPKILSTSSNNFEFLCPLLHDMSMFYVLEMGLYL